MSFSLVTDLERTAYTYGDCWALAIELQESAGYPIVFYGGTETEDGVIPDDETWWFWCHAFNVLPDGRYLDVNGIHTAEEIHEQWYPSFLDSSFRHADVAKFYHSIWHPNHEDALGFMRFEGRVYNLNVEETAEKLIAAASKT